MIRRPAAVVVAALAATLLPGAAGAVPGEPLPAFAGDGTLELGLAKRAIGTDAAGRIVVASVPPADTTGPVTLSRFTAAGAPDASFSGDGQLTLGFTGTASRAPDLFVGPTGILVGLFTSSGFWAWSTTSAGAPVSGYGTAGAAFVPAPDSNASVSVGLAATRVGDGLAVAWQEGTSGTVGRLSAAGQLLPTFGGDGLIEVPGLQLPLLARPSGGLVVNTSTFRSVAPDGTLAPPTEMPVGPDETYADATVDAQDRLLLASFDPTGSTILRRYAPALVPDLAFGTAGALTLPGVAGRFQVVAGRRFLVTSRGLPFGSGSWAFLGFRGRTWITALTGDGAPDPAFGTGGVVMVEDTYSAGQFMNYRANPVSVLAPGPAGGLVVGTEHRWSEESRNPSQSRQVLRQLGSGGTVTAIYASAVAGPSIQDGGDGGATVLARSSPASGSGDQLVRVELELPPVVAPGAPGAPAVSSVDGATFALAWSAASGAPDRYLVSAFEAGSTTAAVSATVPAPALTGALAVPHTGRPYRFEVVAATGEAVGPRSASSAFTLAPFPSAAAFVAQLGNDVPSWRTIPGERATIADSIAVSGEIDAVLTEALQDPVLEKDVDPVTRIYTAYFGRLPDTGGLRYWVAKRRTGATVARISAQFAASSEFQRTYGKLSDRAFVALVYQNVLGRSADGAGLDYWTARLLSKRTSRGQLMASFSESAEHVRRLDRRTFAVRAAFALLGRAAKASEVTPWEASSSSELDQLTAIIESSEYAQRVG